MFTLLVCRDGYARSDFGCFPRWVLALSLDGQSPMARYRNGGPRGLHKPVSGKEPPQWMRRAAGFAAANHGVSADQAEVVVGWYRAHRTGHMDPAALDGRGEWAAK